MNAARWKKLRVGDRVAHAGSGAVYTVVQVDDPGTQPRRLYPVTLAKVIRAQEPKQWRVVPKTTSMGVREG